MIEKLRKKIFWIIQLSLSVIVLGVIIIFSTFNYRNTIISSTMFMDRLEKRIEIKQDEPKEFSDVRNDRYIEGVYKLEIINNNIISKSDDIADEIKDYAIEVSNRSFDEGYIGNYIYIVRKLGTNGKEVTLIESENTIKQLKNTIIISTIIGALGLVMIYIIAKKLSKTIVRPVDEAFEKQKQFVSDASHELKTPLAVIEANADVLQDKIGENKWITYIQNEVQMSVSVFESMIYEKKIRLETNIDDGIEFNGDKDDIKHIISILLDNAIKHTEENNKIIVNTLKEKNEVKIEIKNQGEAIPETEREKIFERFYRIDKARSRAEKRYGLGLPIAKGIVDKYKGSIFTISKDGFTSFIVKL